MEAKYVIRVFTTTTIQVTNKLGQTSVVPEVFVMECDQYPDCKPDTANLIRVIGRQVDQAGNVEAKVVTIYFSPHNTKFVVVESKASSDIVIPKIHMPS